MNPRNQSNKYPNKKRQYAEEQVTTIAQMFDINGRITGARHYGNGHINDTFALMTDDSDIYPKYIIQRLNHYVFKNPEYVMSNIVRVTEALHKNIAATGGDPLEESLTLVKTKDKSSHYIIIPEGMIGDDRTYWRCYLFICGNTFETIPEGSDRDTLARLVGHAYGRFLQNLKGIDMGMLNETIPLFHDGKDRYDRFLAALEVNHEDRRKKCENEIKFAYEHSYMTPVISEMIKEGKIPLRVTHNDTKINNVRIGRRDEALYDKCVLDLDTVMRGSILYDFGDMIRSGSACASEDEEDISKAGINFDLFKNLSAGFIEAAGRDLNATEKNNMIFAARYMTFIIGLRFLTDYLNGDIYFRIHKTDHNLIRAKTQFRMVAEMEKNKSRMEDILASL